MPFQARYRLPESWRHFLFELDLFIENLKHGGLREVKNELLVFTDVQIRTEIGCATGGSNHRLRLDRD
jgi:hypothetical protein